MGIIPNSWKQRREKRKEEWKNIGKNWKKAKEELRAIPDKVRKDLEPKKKKFNSNQDYILNEIRELNKEHKKIQKGMKWWLIGIICSLIVFFPLGIIGIIFMIIDAVKMGKIREQIKEKQREVDMIDIKKGNLLKESRKENKELIKNGKK